MVEAGILVLEAGKDRLKKPNELPIDWDPRMDRRLTTWEMVRHLIRVLETEGEPRKPTDAPPIVRALGGAADTARELCYSLHALADRKFRAAATRSPKAGRQSPISRVRRRRCQSNFSSSITHGDDRSVPDEAITKSKLTMAGESARQAAGSSVPDQSLYGAKE